MSKLFDWHPWLKDEKPFPDKCTKVLRARKSTITKTNTYVKKTIHCKINSDSNSIWSRRINLQCHKNTNIQILTNIEDELHQSNYQGKNI